MPIQSSNCRDSTRQRFYKLQVTMISLAINLTPPSDGGGTRQVIKDYATLIRPFTLVQAVGAFVVGCLSIQTSPTLQSVLSIYLSYGAGMVSNDVVDSKVDAMHIDKKERAIPSGRITSQHAWIFCAFLSTLSCVSVGSNQRFLLWTASNLFIMFSYALGLQKVLFLKNILVGYLGISPLIGAVLVGGTTDDLSRISVHNLIRLAVVGMNVGVAREILKDMEDTRVDKVGGKSTIANVYGPRVAHRIAFGLVFGTCFAMLLPLFQNMFRGPYYLVSWAIGTSMITRAAFLPVKQGQKLLKSSVYVLLGGMVLGFMAANNVN